MAFGKGKESTESNVVKKYIGIAPVQVLAVNPNKAQLEKLYNTTIETEPEYIGTTEVGSDNHTVPQARIDFIVKTCITEKNDIEFTTKISFFVKKQFRFNRDETKVQVIDKYGRTAWVTKEQCQNHEIPTYKNGPALLDSGYRPCYVGEEDLTNFILDYLVIPTYEWRDRNSGKVMQNPRVKAEECEARLDNIEEYFKGNFKELASVIALQPNNRIKVMFGVKITDENKQYQAVYTQKFIRNSAKEDDAFNRIKKDLEERKEAGAYSTTAFEVCHLKEYVVEATDFTQVAAPFDTPIADTDDIFAPPSSDTPDWFNN